jgi:hypothetical protein
LFLRSKSFDLDEIEPARQRNSKVIHLKLEITNGIEIQKSSRLTKLRGV